jgi:peptidyl-prolyl cis-trans isomerase C
MLKPIFSTCMLSCALLVNAHANPTDPVATVNSQTITQQNYDDYVKSRADQLEGKEAPNEQLVIEELVNRELIRQDALSKSIDKTSVFLKKLEEVRNELLMSRGIQEYLAKHPLDDATLKKEYDKIAGEAPNEYKARHILVATEEEAKALLTDLDKGKPFAELAKAKSTDSGTAKNNGDLGWVNRQKVALPFATAMEKLKKGERSTTPVKTEFGWHIIQVDDIRTMQLPSFETVKDRLKNMLQGQQMQEYISGLKKTAKIEILKQSQPVAATKATEENAPVKIDSVKQPPKTEATEATKVEKEQPVKPAAEEPTKQAPSP